jgi:protein TonB
VAAAPAHRSGAEVPVPEAAPPAVEPRPAALALAASLPRPPASPPAAPRRTPADHAGCAEVPHPLALRERGIEGLVQLRVQVGSDGRARAVQLLGSSGWRLFDEAALAKARSCRFRPAYEGDNAVESWVEFPVRFALAQS